MVKFEGNINGKVYTDEKEFFYDLSKLNKTDDMYVSYRYVSVPGALDDKVEQTDNSNRFQKSIWKTDNRNFVDYTKYVRDNEYVRNITQKNDVNPDDELINKLKNASNKSEIKRNVYKKLEDFTNLISNNLLKINELKSDYKKFEEKINLINSQIKTLDNANNNYYLNKEYYTNISKYLEDELTPVIEKQEKKDDCDCGDKCCDKCNCNDKSLKTLFFDESFEKTPREVLENLNIYNLSDLVDYFLKKC
jgi:hypothetical protein